MLILIYLATLPEPYHGIVLQLGKLSLEGVNSNTLVFTFDKVKDICPDIVTIPGAINGFGLLHAIQHYTFTGITMTFQFIHHSFQEFLASYYVASLPSVEVLEILRKRFWSDSHCRMFAIYMTHTKGWDLAFKQFLSGGNESIIISDKFLSDPKKCIRLYHYFYKAENFDKCKIIGNTEYFAHKLIDFGNIKLLPFDVESIALVLIHSVKSQWESVNLDGCEIQDHGVEIIGNKLSNANITIVKLDLSANCLTSASLQWVEELVIGCQVKELRIGTNNFGGDNKVLCTILSNPSCKLESLN